MRPAPWLYTLFLLSLVLPLPAGAVTVDEAARALERGRRVYDLAGVLSESDERRLDDRVSAAENAGVAEWAIFVIDRLEGATIEQFALELGERFKVGRRDVENGIVLVASIQDRKLRVEVGRDLQGTLPDSAATRLARTAVVGPFRARRYADGLEAAVGALLTPLESAGGVDGLPPARPAPASFPLLGWVSFLLGALTVGAAFAAWPRGSSVGADRWRLPAMVLGIASLGCAILAGAQPSGVAWGIILVALPPAAFALWRLTETARLPVPLDAVGLRSARATTTFLVLLATGLVVGVGLAGLSGWIIPYLALAVPLGFALRGYHRRAPRACPQCSGALRWLPENEEPQFLRDDEDLEQRLGSVDYDVWRCQKCERSAIVARAQVFARYTECPKCHRRTLSRRSEMDEHATAWADGSASEITECHNPRCGYHDTKHTRLERRGVGDLGGGIIIIPPIWGGGWGSGGGGQSGGGWSAGDPGGGVDAGDFGGGGGFDGGGGTVDW